MNWVQFNRRFNAQIIELKETTLFILEKAIKSNHSIIIKDELDELETFFSNVKDVNTKLMKDFNGASLRIGLICPVEFQSGISNLAMHILHLFSFKFRLLASSLFL